ncbi:50S ribosomal protein L4 [Candidatus Amesbacteria bacterium RIFCSPLOWO2_02_FULL_48_11]|uniref:Large ribosomal subunit protein uL4 n=5 Tax=Candidatus Amesiibacteriota TaxID=1752730 RepID=A0A1F4Z6T8_9BACT|nr:MAG: 50S ribosomal protein L4 [Candidatus Amesbacteria bacterium GW2011_GWA2_47_11]KKU94862.1 MAG: 50S ribosomal protein L4 [Candidatus Amesbacteria bacterium GW2011_GWC1_48_10]KKW01050.1 MAG: 50S ribosomal protein L4 [Candidatus Amesbacteria bacterium GW2011_GWA1_48_9]OGC89629.1 MAG: 50S ribosomal protein L4 [Candidatus Amesbacteria bacterium RBG_19FT_COMBO_48_16]OGC96873.1 MAG: 50S ribosomal protein L4 [Candidatus Amesbacteria bacterium RIFCSPHIGHO2_02_FULL_48_21]OGC97874.1 MAG: 50S ribos
MITAATYDIKGQQGEKIKLPEKIFGAKVKPIVMAQAVRVYLSNQRKALAKTKTRADVAKTTAKMYRQKGTGRARHGSYAAPIFVGGGVAHGPTGKQNYSLKMPAKMRQAAIIGALSEKAAAGAIKVLAGTKKVTKKTKNITEAVNKMQLQGERILMVTQKGQEEVKRAWRNIIKVTTITTDELNTYLIIAHKQLVITSEALEALIKRYAA